MRRGWRWVPILVVVAAGAIVSSLHVRTPRQALRIEIDAELRLTLRVIGDGSDPLFGPVDLATPLEALEELDEWFAMNDGTFDHPLEIVVADVVIWQWVVRLLEIAERSGYEEADLIDQLGRRIHARTEFIPWEEGRTGQYFKVRVSGLPLQWTTVGFDFALTPDELERELSQRTRAIGGIRPEDPASRAFTLDALATEIGLERERARADGRPFRLGFDVDSRRPVTLIRPDRGVWFAPCRDVFDVLVVMVAASPDDLRFIDWPVRPR